MANRRMFSKKITDTDIFLDMPMSAQCLYFHINMAADDDGFIGNVKTIRRMIGASEDDLKLLFAKEFLFPFESGVVVIKDWKIHNYIRKDRYSETVYQDEKAQIVELENGKYEIGMTGGQPDDNQRSPQDRLGKDRLGKDREVTTTDGSSEDSPPQEFTALRDFETLWLFPNQFQKEDLYDLIDQQGEVLVSAAIRLAGTKDVTKKNAINFLKAVLKEWAENNVTNLEQVDAYQLQRGQKNKNQYPTKHTGRTETMPDWADEDNKGEEIDEEKQKEFAERLERIRNRGKTKQEG